MVRGQIKAPYHSNQNRMTMETPLSVEELLEQLNKYPQYMVNHALVSMLLKGTIDYTQISEAYVQALEKFRKDKESLIAEAEVLGSLWLDKCKEETEDNHDVIHRTLVFLNHENSHLCADDLNEKWHYDPQKDNQLSKYERDKKRS